MVLAPDNFAELLELYPQMKSGLKKCTDPNSFRTCPKPPLACALDKRLTASPCTSETAVIVPRFADHLCFGAVRYTMLKASTFVKGSINQQAEVIKEKDQQLERVRLEFVRTSHDVHSHRHNRGPLLPCLVDEAMLEQHMLRRVTTCMRRLSALLCELRECGSSHVTHACS